MEKAKYLPHQGKSGATGLSFYQSGGPKEALQEGRFLP